MKRFNSPITNSAYFLYRMVSPIVDPIKAGLGIIRYPKYFIDLVKFNNATGYKNFNFADLFPILNENTSYTQFDYHYFYQQLWVFENVLKNKPSKHVDVGSTYEMSGYISTIVPTEFVDIRPVKTVKDNLTIVKGTITDLPYQDNSLESISCLHVLEHIGLGRYGDTLDPEGIKKAIKELVRVLKPGGNLYISTPIGRERVCFNAHRVNKAQNIIKWAEPARLVSFDIIDDNGNKILNYTTDKCDTFNYALGMYKFTKN